MSESDINAGFNAKLAMREDERERRAGKLPQEYESLEAYHEDRLVKRAPLQASAVGGFDYMKRRR